MSGSQTVCISSYSQDSPSLLPGRTAARRHACWLHTIAVLAPLLLFHLQSLSQIHWHYLTLMLTILSWFPLAMFVDPDKTCLTLSRLFARRALLTTYVVAGLFAVCQLVRFAYAGDAALTGQGRLWALHMLEARQLSLSRP